ncbi:MAG: hypothetical protein MI866_05970 [Bacteroidales bacterium]|nr:hypothetical protein [Bacteroidales bacterium]
MKLTQLLTIVLIMGLISSCSNAQGRQREIDNSSGATAHAEDSIILDEPDLENSVTLMQALQNRRSTRSFANEPIRKQDLSNMLWAAGGVNRDNGGRTVPLLGDIAIYVAMSTGVYHYQAKEHVLTRIISEDIRHQISEQETVKKSTSCFYLCN